MELATHTSPEPPLDLLVAGGGLVGLALALAVAHAGGGDLAVAVCDPAFAAASRPDDLRASAVSAGARRMLETLGVWPALAAEAQPITAMEITDSRGEDVLRPVFLTFGGEAAPGEPFAHMVPNGALLAASPPWRGRGGRPLRSEPGDGLDRAAGDPRGPSLRRLHAPGSAPRRRGWRTFRRAGPRRRHGVRPPLWAERARAHRRARGASWRRGAGAFPA